MSGETDLPSLLRSLRPERRAGVFVDVRDDPRAGIPAACIEASVWEPDWRSLVCRQETADALGLADDDVAARIAGAGALAARSRRSRRSSEQRPRAGEPELRRHRGLAP